MPYPKFLVIVSGHSARFLIVPQAFYFETHHLVVVVPVVTKIAEQERSGSVKASWRGTPSPKTSSRLGQKHYAIEVETRPFSDILDEHGVPLYFKIDRFIWWNGDEVKDYLPRLWLRASRPRFIVSG